MARERKKKRWTPLDEQLQIAEEMGRGVDRKVIAFTHNVAQSTLTAIKHRFPLFAWSESNTKDPQDDFKF